MPKPTIVLVHGAWADGSSWNAVPSELQGQPQATIDAILAAATAVTD